MDKEIRYSKQKIIELNLIIEKLKEQLLEYESQNGKVKVKNELFCDLYKSFLQKKLIKHKIDMIIGMYIKSYGKQMESKYKKLSEKEKLLKKKISELTEELHMLKYGKKMPSDLEEYQNQINIEETHTPQSDGENENKLKIYDEKDGIRSLKKIISNRSGSQGITRVVDVGTVTKEVGNAVITTKTTQISYKRRRVTDGQQ